MIVTNGNMKILITLESNEDAKDDILDKLSMVKDLFPNMAIGWKIEPPPSLNKPTPPGRLKDGRCAKCGWYHLTDLLGT